MSKEKSKQLANCPFCGGEAKLMRFPKCERKYVVICENEQCMASVGNYSYSKEKAIEAWNTRKPMERIIERLKDFNGEVFIRANGRANGKTLAYGYSKGIEKAVMIVKEEGE